MFREAAALGRIDPALTEHALLRFLGRRTKARFQGEVYRRYLERAEGVRVKHRPEENSIKKYDQQGSVLRIETTINKARRFKVRKMTVGKGVRRRRWIPMRPGVADLARRVEIRRAAKERYWAALAVVAVSCPAPELWDAVSWPVTKDDRPYRALRPVRPAEATLFAAVLQGPFHLQGFTHRDLRNRLAPRLVSDPPKRRTRRGPKRSGSRRRQTHRGADNAYKEFKIGSGPTEAMCKVLTHRLKGAGMRWDREGAEPIMALIALEQSNAWESYWAAQAKVA